MIRAFVLALTLGACASAPRAALPNADPVIAAERAFAADGAQRGWAAAFRRAAAPDATTLSPDPVNAHESLAQIEGDGAANLDWRPAYAGIARSGDFGFTTGPFQVRGREGIVGHYFTVWRLQPSGAWKWIFDAGTDVRDAGPAVAIDADIPRLPVAARGSSSMSAAIGPVRAIETRMAETRMAGASGRESGRVSGGATIADWLAEDARVNRPGAPAAIGREAGAALARQWDTLQYEAPLRMDSSAAGDMVFSMGAARWTDGAAERRGYYARIWQLHPDGWRIVFDELAPRRDG